MSKVPSGWDRGQQPPDMGKLLHLPNSSTTPGKVLPIRADDGILPAPADRYNISTGLGQPHSNGVADAARTAKD